MSFFNSDPAFLAVQLERLTEALRENTRAQWANTRAQQRGTTATNILSEETFDMAVKLEDWERALQADTDATNAMEAAIAHMTAQIAALGIQDPRLDAVLAGINANSERTAALALANTPAVPAPVPVPDPVPVIDPATGQPFAPVP